MEKLVKVVIYVPVTHGDDIRGALGEAGAGHIGNYDFCSFSQKGIGRFRPGEGANPHVGTVGDIEAVEEERIETVCPLRIVREIIAKVREVHPYEEMAYDVYPLLGIED